MRKNIALAVPVFGVIYPAPFENFLMMMLSAASQEHDRYRIDLTVRKRELIHDAMNRSAELLLKGDHDALIIADDDCLPPFDAISRLLRHYEAGRDIVAGAGIMRNYPYTTTVGRTYPEGVSVVTDEHGQVGLRGFYWVDRIHEEPDDLVPCDFCGFPIAIISRKVFETVPYPWFGMEIDGGSCTHDVHFGLKAKRAGFEILVDRTISCGHQADPQIITIEQRDHARRAHVDAKRMLELAR